MASVVVYSSIKSTENPESHLEEEPTHSGGSRGERLMVQAWSHRHFESPRHCATLNKFFHFSELHQQNGIDVFHLIGKVFSLELDIQNFSLTFISITSNK